MSATRRNLPAVDRTSNAFVMAAIVPKTGGTYYNAS
jgi:hypothetical protein